MIEIAFTCARTDCDAEERVRVGEIDVDEAVSDFLPAGWGYDFPAVDGVLHCEEHRC